MKLVCWSAKGDKKVVAFFDDDSTVEIAAEQAAAALRLQDDGLGIWTFFVDNGRRFLRPSDTLKQANLVGGEHVAVGRIG